MNQPEKFRLLYVPLWTIPLMLACGFLFMAIMDISVLSSPGGILYIAFLALTVGTTMLKGYEYIEYRIEGRISWLDAPVKRLALTILLQSAYLCGVLIILVLVLNLIEGVESPAVLLNIFVNAAAPGIGFTVIATFTANFLLFFRNWKQAVVREESLKRDKLALEYEALKSQVNPHFLFNSFTALSSLVYKDQDKAVEFIRQLSNVYRYVLQQKDVEVVPLAKELEFVRSVAYLYSIRHEGDLSISIDVHPSDNDCIVPISLQILLENAVKHNVVSDDYPLRVAIYRDGDDTIAVKNNYQPRETNSPSSGIGLQNINSRYQYLMGRGVEVIQTDQEFLVKVPIVRGGDRCK